MDRANAEDALVPISKIIEYTGKKEAQDGSGLDPEKVMAEIVNARPKNKENLESGRLFPIRSRWFSGDHLLWLSCSGMYCFASFRSESVS